MSIKRPNRGIVYWPVGTGDSSTVFVDEETIMQIDLRHLDKSEDKDEPYYQVIDELVEILPTKDVKPYLSVFVLTHADKDHIQGFEKLLDEVTIGEIWFTPKILTDDELKDDAEVFKKEVDRRIKNARDSNSDIESGDRIRIIGYDGILEDDDYKDLPDEVFSYPGEDITELDGTDFEERFCAFIHSPFKENTDGDRNDTSLSMQVELKNGDNILQALFFGDLKYEILIDIFSKTKENKNDEKLKWHILLAPHHCSKCVMYLKEDGKDILKQDILDEINNSVNEEGYIISSSEPIPSKNEAGDNPPHRKAANRYEEIAPTDFICSMEHPDEDNPEPVIFELDDNGINYQKPSKKNTNENGEKKIAAGITSLLGSKEATPQKKQFG